MIKQTPIGAVTRSRLSPSEISSALSCFLDEGSKHMWSAKGAEWVNPHEQSTSTEKREPQQGAPDRFLLSCNSAHACTQLLDFLGLELEALHECTLYACCFTQLNILGVSSHDFILCCLESTCNALQDRLPGGSRQ